MKKRKILVVDDEESILILVSNLLGNEGFDVLTATNGYDCLKILKKTIPDLIVIDIMMPGMNGIELAGKIRSDPRTRKTKIVFLTVVKSDEVRSDRLKKVKAVDFITKPFDNDDLVAKVKKFTK